jgi:hypothetical protein
VSYTVNWLTKVITVPTTDLTLVSGTRYSLLLSDFLAEVRRLEWLFDGGLWAAAIIEHSDTRFDFAGADYAPFDEVINGYTVEFIGVVTRLDLKGSNNNLADVLVENCVQLVTFNSAGLQVYSTGSGLSPSEQLALSDVHTYMGLNSGNPIEHTPTQSITDAADIDVTRSGDGESLSRLERQ